MKKSIFRAIIKRNKRLLIAMILVSSLGCGLLSGLANGYLSLQNTLDDYISDMKYPDAVIDTEVMTRDALDELSSLPGVEAADARLTGNLIIVGKGGVFYSMQAMTYSDDEFQGTYYWEKSDKEAKYPIFIEYRFSKLNDLHAGDYVELRAGDRAWKCMVKGVISRPEMIAYHKLGEMTVVSTDIGYVYVPAELLYNVNNPEYEAARNEWEKNNQEYLAQKKNADDQHNEALKRIEEAEKILKEKKNELNEKLKGADVKRKELISYLEEIEDSLEELKKKEQELIDKKKELDDAAEQLRQGKEKLAAGKKELSEKKALLDSTKATLEASRKELLKQFEELKKKEKELNQKKKELKDAKQEIKKKTAEIDDTEKQLISTKAELLEKQDQLTVLKDTVGTLKVYADEVADIINNAEGAPDPYEFIKQAADKLGKMYADKERMDKLQKLLSDEKISEELLAEIGITKSKLEAAIAEPFAYYDKMQKYANELRILIKNDPKPEAVEKLIKAVVNESKESWARFTKNLETPKFDYNKLEKKINDGIKETNDGLSQIRDAEKQIAEGRKLIKEKQKEIKSGAALIADGEKQLKEAKEALTQGLAQVDDGLKQVTEGYAEYEKYAQQIKDEESKLRDGQAEYDEYYKQFLEGQAALPDAKGMLDKAKEQIDDGLKQIDDAEADGKSALRDGEKELDENRTKAEDSWNDALKQFEDAESELKDAKDKLDEWDGYNVFCNQFLLRLEDGAEPYSTLSEAEKILGRDKVKNSYTYDDSAVKLSRDLNVDPIKVMSLYVPAVFFVVSLIAEFLFMSFMIRQCRRDIGILRALGFSRDLIVALFCCINIFVSVGAVILGAAVSFGVTRYMGTFYKDYFFLYYFSYSVHWQRAFAAVGLTVAVGQTATILSTGYVSRIHPSEAMTRPAPSASSHEGRLLSKLKIPPFFKYCISSLLRNKKRLLFSIVCLSSSVVIIFASFSFDLSKDLIVSDQFEDRIHYDCEIFLSTRPNHGFLKRLSDSGLINEKEVVYYYRKDISANGVTKEQTIKAVSPDSQLLGIYDESRNRIHTSDEGILLEKHTAEPLNVTKGDTVYIDDTPVVVSEITEEYDNRSQYMSIDSAKKLGSRPVLYSVICTVDEKNETELMEFLSKEESYLYAAFTTKVYAGIESGFKAFGICAVIALAFAVMIGSVIVINTICTNLQEQKKELCVLRTLGFQYSGLSFRLMTQAAVYYIFASAIGIPSGIAVTKFILGKMEIEKRSYPFVNDYRVYLFTLILVFAYVFISHLISMRTIKKWDMVETVKDKE